MKNLLLATALIFCTQLTWGQFTKQAEGVYVCKAKQGQSETTLIISKVTDKGFHYKIFNRELLAAMDGRAMDGDCIIYGIRKIFAEIANEEKDDGIDFCANLDNGSIEVQEIAPPRVAPRFSGTFKKKTAK